MFMRSLGPLYRADTNYGVYAALKRDSQVKTMGP